MQMWQHVGVLFVTTDLQSIVCIEGAPTAVQQRGAYELTGVRKADLKVIGHSITKMKIASN
jgi:hypothetical protein